MSVTDTRPPLTLSPNHMPDVTGLLFDCRRWSKAGADIGCGPGQKIAIAYEGSKSFMTGGTHILVNRCAGCRQIINGSEMQSSRVTKETS